MKIQSVQNQQMQNRPVFAAVGSVKRPLPSKLFPKQPRTHQLLDMTLGTSDVKSILENLKALMSKVRLVIRGKNKGKLVLGREVITTTKGHQSEEKIVPAKIKIRQGRNITTLSEEFDLGDKKVPDALFDNVFGALRQKRKVKRGKK